MKALSLWQPHVAAIAVGLKPWETRDWPTSYRGPLAMHAAKRPWNDAGEWHALAGAQIGLRLIEVTAKRFSEYDPQRIREIARIVRDRVLAFGAVICIADVVDCVRTSELRGKIPVADEFWGDFSDGEEGKGRYAFKLENVRLLPAPLPWRGMQGFFEVEIAGATPIAETAQLDLFGDTA